MRNAKLLIKENNEKRKLLHAENEQVYEDFLLYIRTDLRIAEYESEELLMDILDHLLEGQENGKSATDLFGAQPQAYADELIAGLPYEKKRNVITFLTFQLFYLLGWVSLSFGIVNFIFPLFTNVQPTVSLGSSIVLLTVIFVVCAFGVWMIFKLIRSPLFSDQKQKTKAQWKIGFLGAGSFALIMLLNWFLPDFGPEVHLAWWMYLIFSAVILSVSKGLQHMTN